MKRLSWFLLLLVPLVLWSVQEVLAQNTFFESSTETMGGIEDTLPVLSILEAKDWLGQSVRVQGIVVTDEVRIRNGKRSIHIQDDTGGLHVYAYEGKPLSQGDFIDVTGVLGDYKGLMEIRPAAEGIRLLKSGQALPKQEVLTAQDWKNTRKLEALKGSRVRIVVQVNELPEAPKDGSYRVPARLENGTGKLLLLTGEDAYKEAALKAGSWYEVSGILTQYNQYQLWLQHSSDISLLDPPRG